MDAVREPSSLVSGCGSAFAARRGGQTFGEEVLEEGKKKRRGLKTLGGTVVVLAGVSVLAGAAFLGTLVAAKRFGWKLPGPLDSLKMKMPG